MMDFNNFSLLSIHLKPLIMFLIKLKGINEPHSPLRLIRNKSFFLLIIFIYFFPFSGSGVTNLEYEISNSAI